MTRSPRFTALCWAGLTAACASPAATPPAATTPDPTPPPPVVSVPPPSAGVRIGPQRARFLAHQRVDIFNEHAALPPRQEVGFKTWFSVVVADSTDAAGRRRARFTIDSIAADSGVVMPPTINLGVARGLVVDGWLAPNGEVSEQTYSDSTVINALGPLLGSFRRFFPLLPPDGARPGASWTDSVTTTEPAGPTMISRRAAVSTRAGGWATQDGVMALRLDVVETYAFAGSGETMGQALSLSGSGVRTGVDYLTADGHYIGGMSRDSAALTITLPIQGESIPRRQIATLTITVLAP